MALNIKANKLWQAIIITLVLSASVNARPTTYVADNQQGGHASHGAVATEVKECSDIGINLLKAGGNAADAAIGAQLCVGVMASHHSGIGGGGFTTVRSADGHIEVIDFREFAPGAATEDMFAKTQVSKASIIGGLSVAVPGELRGLEALHKRHGKLPWKQLFEPAIDLAQNGFILTPEAAKYQTKQGYEFLTTQEPFKTVFAPTGSPAVAGDVLHRPTYAATLTEISNHGADAFYQGPLAERTVAAVKDHGGILTLDDLQKYEVKIRQPSRIRYRDQYLYSAPAPAGGTVALAALSILSGYDISQHADAKVSTHLIDEALRFAYAQRMNYGDPEFVDNVRDLERFNLKESTANSIRSRLTIDKAQAPDYYDPQRYAAQPEHGTSHVVAADEHGNVVSLTSTINWYYGSQIMTADGIILNDEMDDFSTKGQSNGFGYTASPANYIAPYKRPLSSITPIIMESLDGNFTRAHGQTGGSTIISSGVQVASNLVDLEMDVLGAVSAARFHDQLIPDQVSFEKSFNKTIYDAMASLGHKVKWSDDPIAAAHGITRDQHGNFNAASDPRKLGSGAAVF